MNLALLLTVVTRDGIEYLFINQPKSLTVGGKEYIGAAFQFNAMLKDGAPKPFSVTFDVYGSAIPDVESIKVEVIKFTDAGIESLTVMDDFYDIEVIPNPLTIAMRSRSNTV